MTAGDHLITLHSGNAGLQICPAAGGSIARYWHEDGNREFEWLRPATVEAIAARDPLGMSSFPLVPFSNRIRDGKFRYLGEEISLPLNFAPEKHAIHGQGWQSPWKVAEVGDDYATLEFVHMPGDWPFAYRARQDFMLGEDALAVSLSVTNGSDRRMPAGLGPHPYFVRTPQARITAHVGRMWETDDEVMGTELIDPPADRDLNQGVVAGSVAMDNTFTGWDGTALIEWPEWHARLSMEAEPPLKFLVAFTPPGEDFFCVEPVSNITDAFNLAAGGRRDTGITALEPQETLTGIVRFRPEIGG